MIKNFMPIRKQAKNKTTSTPLFINSTKLTRHAKDL